MRDYKKLDSFYGRLLSEDIFIFCRNGYGCSEFELDKEFNTQDLFSNPVFSMREASISRIDRQDKYQRILRAGIAVFARRGVFRATISEIAREAGVADGTIYLYFKNKDDILARFFEGRTEEIFARFRKAIDEAETSRDKLFSLICCHMEAFQEDREMAVVFQAETRKIHAMAHQVNDISARYRDLIAEIIEEGQAEGIIRKELYIALVKRFILGAVDEVVNTWVLAEGKYDLVSMAEPLVELFLRGIGSASAE